MAGSTGGTNPIAVIDDNPMSVRQWIVVVLMVLLNALDGFDVLSSAFAAPGITKEWGILAVRARHHAVGRADRHGLRLDPARQPGRQDRAASRRCCICLVIMAIGMYLAHGANSVTSLTAFRFFTGLGIGGMLAATNAVTAESTSKASRSLAMALYVIGYPVGGVIGGYAAQSWLLVDYDWRAVFLFGAVVTAVMIPLVMLLVPETPAFHAARRKPDALERINRSLRALSSRSSMRCRRSSRRAQAQGDRHPVQARPAQGHLAAGAGLHGPHVHVLLRAEVRRADRLGCRLHAAGGGQHADLGQHRRRHRRLPVRLPAEEVGHQGPDHRRHAAGRAWRWSISAWGTTRWPSGGSSAFLQMFFLNAAIVGYYAAFARGFPAYARATGTGFALGVGRAGAAGSPIIAGFLFTTLGGTQIARSLNDQLLPVSIVMTVGSLIGVVLMLMLPLRDADRDMETRAAKPECRSSESNPARACRRPWWPMASCSWRGRWPPILRPTSKGQTRQVLGEIDRLLAAAGTSKERILSATIYLADVVDLRATMNRPGRPGCPPMPSRRAPPSRRSWSRPNTGSRSRSSRWL